MQAVTVTEQRPRQGALAHESACADQPRDAGTGRLRWAAASRIEADDLESAGEQMNPWAPMQYTRLDRRPAAMRGHILRLGTTLFGHWGGGCSKIFSTAVPAQRFAVLLPVQGIGRYGTAGIKAGDALVARGGSEVTMYTGADFFAVLIAATDEKWQEVASACGFRLNLPSRGAMMLTPGTLDVSSALALGNAAAAMALLEPERFDSAALRASLDDQLLTQVGRILQQPEASPSPGARVAAARHRAAVRARDYIDANIDQGLSLASVCRASHTSARALEYGFRELFGVTPMAYVKFARLARVRRALLEVPEVDAAVTSAATRWGFWHLGQFSKDYRALFGELPSETLARASRRIPRRQGSTITPART